MAELHPRIVGTGHAAPEKVRRNDDPVFKYLHDHPVKGKDLFQGYRERRCLAEGETLIDIMVPAAEMALAESGRVAEDVDLVLGVGSLSDYLVPNVLSEVHQRLGLPARAWPIPLMNGFSQFPAAVMMADALIRAGRARTILLSFGDNWTRYVNYDTPQAVSASDGAAAAVMALSDDPQAFRMVDQVCDVDTSYYGTMKMSGQEIHGAEAPPGVSLEDDAAYTHPFFQIDKAGQEGFREFGVQRAPEAVRRLLRIHHRDPAEVCLISHQASSVLMDHWRDVIRPGHYVNTLKTYANLVQTSVPFNLSWGLKHDPGFYQDWLATLCVGPDMHASAMLMRRG